MSEQNVYRVVRMARLAYPHLLWKCDFAEAHTRAMAGEEDSPEGRRRAFERFAAEVGAERMARCRKHQADWAEAARAACELVRRTGGVDVDDSPLLDGLSEAAFSFFDHPIHLDGDQLGNGQHRSCALRAAGVAECPIEA